MARYKPSGELMPRHVKALSSASKKMKDYLEWHLEVYGADFGTDFRAEIEKELRDLKEAMLEAREIAAQQRLSRKHRAF